MFFLENYNFIFSKSENIYIFLKFHGHRRVLHLVVDLLFKAEVHMVENKEESLARARERGLALGLKNVWYYQANMEYYQEPEILILYKTTLKQSIATNFNVSVEIHPIASSDPPYYTYIYKSVFLLIIN